MASTLHEDLFDDLSNTAKWDQDIAERLAKDSNATWKKIKERVEEMSPGEAKQKGKIGWRQFSAAAAIVILFAGVIYYRNSKKPIVFDSQSSQKVRFKNEILPASGTAFLTLSDGSVIQLDSAKEGELAKQGTVTVIKTDSGQLNYKARTNGDGAMGFNTLTIPRGSQYQVVLPDGSKVWLNAASSLSYPVAFTGADRSVALIGEAYFEIAKNKEKPFRVEVSGSVVRVLGTHFNVNAYPDELVTKTSVLEGSVAVKYGKDSTIVKSGEEMRLNRQRQINLTPINAEQVIAWRDKLFWFQGASFEQIMRQFSRWYNIDIVYQGKVSQTFTGILPCNLPLSNLLSILEKGGNVQFTIEGKKVTVRP